MLSFISLINYYFDCDYFLSFILFIQQIYMNVID